MQKKSVWKLKSRKEHWGVKIKFFQLVKRPTQVCTSPNLNFLNSTVNFNIFFAYQQTQSMSFLSSLRAYAKWGIESEGLWGFKLLHKAWLAYFWMLVAMVILKNSGEGYKNSLIFVIKCVSRKLLSCVNWQKHQVFKLGEILFIFLSKLTTYFYGMFDNLWFLNWSCLIF